MRAITCGLRRVGLSATSNTIPAITRMGDASGLAWRRAIDFCKRLNPPDTQTLLVQLRAPTANPFWFIQVRAA